MRITTFSVRGDEVNNLGYMHDRTVGSMVGGLVVLLGWIAVVCSECAAAIAKAVARTA